MPRSELAAASDRPYNIAANIPVRADGFTVETDETAGWKGAMYDFSNDFRPERAVLSDGYGQFHTKFEREGRIKHTYENCPERKKRAIIRICDEKGNWTEVSIPQVSPAN